MGEIRGKREMEGKTEWEKEGENREGGKREEKRGKGQKKYGKRVKKKGKQEKRRNKKGANFHKFRGSKREVVPGKNQGESFLWMGEIQALGKLLPVFIQE